MIKVRKPIDPKVEVEFELQQNGDQVDILAWKDGTQCRIGRFTPIGLILFDNLSEGSLPSNMVYFCNPKGRIRVFEIGAELYKS